MASNRARAAGTEAGPVGREGLQPWARFGEGLSRLEKQARVVKL